MSLLVGADVGGSSTVVAIEEAGEIRARVTAPGAALRPDMVLRSATTIADAIRRALAEANSAKAEVVVIGAAGAGRAQEAGELARAMRAEELAGQIHVTTDGDIALLAAFGRSPGILISAGTGSVGLARDAEGVVHRVGGYGWQMGDEGSGYALGRAALVVVGRASDGRADQTALTERVLNATRSDDLSRLIRWATAAGPGEVAALAPVVLAAAHAGDPAAKAIVAVAAGELLQLAIGLRRRAPEPGELPVALSGGVLQPGSPLAAELTKLLQNEAGITVRQDAIDPVQGALILARELTISLTE